MEIRSPFHVECLNCEAVVIAAYTPLPVETFAQICIAHRCPYCGSKSNRHTPSNGPVRPPQKEA